MADQKKSEKPKAESAATKKPAQAEASIEAGVVPQSEPLKKDPAKDYAKHPKFHKFNRES